MSDDNDTAGAQGGKHGILSLSIKEVGVLYSAYMPFLENGGLFIPTRKQYELGDEVFVLRSLVDDPERIPLAGTVAWITPPNAQGNRAQGIGIRFNDKDNPAREKIEKYLTGMLNSGRVTHTL